LNVYLCGAQAQDTIVIKGQPDWIKGQPIFDNCSFFEDRNDDPLSFAAVKQKQFIPYTDSLRRNVPSLRPQIIQWLSFTIRNSSPSDTVRLLLNPGAHYFTDLYDENGWVAKGGVYEGQVSGMQRIAFNLILLPNQQKTFWLQTRERQGHFTPSWISLETSSTFTKSQFDDMVNSRLLFLLLAILTGCLFFISVFAASQYVLYKDRAFPWYIAYTLSATLTGLFWIDIRHQFGIFSSFTLDLIFSIFLFLIPVLYTFFIGEMLRLRQQFKKGWRLVEFLLIIACLQMVIEFFTIRTGKFIFNDYYGYFVSMVPVTVLNLVLLVLTAMSREKVKWFMFCGLVSMLLLWCLPLMLSSLITFKAGLIDYVIIFVPFYFLLGLTIEAICFAFALSYRGKLIYTEKNNLQKQYRSQLQEALDKRTAELEAQNKILEVQHIEQVKAAFGKKMAEAEMNTLRAQMNPHFIFNCLNSIKLYALENDSNAASEYLTLFSQLIRLVLENSRSEKITLKKELETVELYIKLEAMRFKDKVGYSIAVSPEIDIQYTELPPLLIQPYVENAIWHGLMHKKEGGCITIEIGQQENDTLLIDITDNGIGRERAAMYKSKSATSQKSFGLKMTSDRIEIINQIYGIRAEVKVIDLKNDLNYSTGTKVMIKIPV
jgi:sensor histidine kinase YesM